MARVEIRELGLVPYQEGWRLQSELLEQRRLGEIPDTLLLCEHPRVVTLGRRSQADAVLDPDVPVVQVERGGEATYHAPGQLVGYPIMHLDERGRDLRRYLRELEAVLIAGLADFGLEAFAREGLTGVWTAAGKLGSIGIAVRRWISWHGFALNIDNDPAEFRCIHPCGMDASVMTSVAAIQGPGPWRAQVSACIQRRFLERFGAEPS